MNEEDFTRLYPNLYHIAEGGSWPSIRQFGLESTSALLDRFEITGSDRISIESQHRAIPVPLEHDKYGSAMIRDQTPISDTKLASCLDGMTNTEWYTLLNGFVFLWPSSRRRNGMLSSYASRNHDVLTIDTKKFFALYGGTFLVSPINSGSTLHNPARRGRGTFVPLKSCPFEEWRRRKGKRPEEIIAEVVVPYRIAHVEEIVLKVESYSGEDQQHLVWGAP